MPYPATVYLASEPHQAVKTVQIVDAEENYNGNGATLYTAADGSTYVANPAGAGLVPAP
jgi:hypothetical protein